MVTLGVDEAGKGPVLGSMFAAAVGVDSRESLPDGIADSKRLTPARREKLAATLLGDDGIHVGVAEIPVARIDDPATDMNGLAVAAHAEAIEGALEALESPPDTLAGLCDACDTDEARFARRVAEACDLEGTLRTDADVTIEARHGADDEDPLVGAASIVAKVERDAHVAALAAKYGDVGSGYPSDPTTRAFLESHVNDRGELPACARTSWSTCANVLEAAGQRGLEEF